MLHYAAGFAHIWVIVEVLRLLSAVFTVLHYAVLFLVFFRLMWVGGLLAAFSSIIYPSISALVSRNAVAEQQGAVLGILTGE